MARKRHKNRTQRDVTTPSLTQLLHPTVKPSRSYLQEIEDRREFHPERADRSALSLFGRPHRLAVHKVEHRPARPVLSKRSSPPHRIQFVDPRQVVVCVRRQQRKEVLHALGRTGRGARAPRRRTWRSDISCR